MKLDETPSTYLQNNLIRYCYFIIFLFFFSYLYSLRLLGELQMFGSPSTPVLENPEYQTRWYFKYFLGKRE